MEDHLIKKLEGEAIIRKITLPIMKIDVSPEDLDSPLSFQLFVEKIMESITRTLEEPPRPKYMAEVRFKDALGMPVKFVVDLGERTPYFSKDKVKVRLTLEFYEEDEEAERER